MNPLCANLHDFGNCGRCWAMTTPAVSVFSVGFSMFWTIREYVGQFLTIRCDPCDFLRGATRVYTVLVDVGPTRTFLNGSDHCKKYYADSTRFFTILMVTVRFSTILAESEESRESGAGRAECECDWSALVESRRDY